MIIIIEKKDTDVQKAIANDLFTNGVVDSIEYATFSKNQLAMSETEVVKAVMSIKKKFAVKSQWTAVYRILTDFCGWDTNIASFCRRMNHLLNKHKVCYRCEYQSIQKTLTGSLILIQDFSAWQQYRIPKKDRVFKRQFYIAKEFLNLLKFNV